MFEIKSNQDRKYSIFENGIVSEGAKIKLIKQNYIEVQRCGKKSYSLTDQEATIIDSDGKTHESIEILILT